MPILSTVHKCSVCLTPFKEYLDACNCEAKGVPQEVRFAKGHSLWVLVCRAGDTPFPLIRPVLASFVYLCPKTNTHRWAYVLDSGLGYEVVAEPRVGGNFCNFDVAHSNSDHPIGYHKLLLDQRREYAGLLPYPLEF